LEKTLEENAGFYTVEIQRCVDKNHVKGDAVFPF
jgi:hypothetical protein